MKFFPEWLTVEVAAPLSSKCSLPHTHLNPGSIEPNQFSKSIQTFRLFARTYSTLRGFPFWEILGYWFHVSEYWRSQPVTHRGENVAPVAEILPNGVARLRNPSDRHVDFRFRVLRRLPEDVVVSISPTPDLHDDTLLIGNQILQRIALAPSQELYVCLVNVPGGWRSLSIEFIGQFADEGRVLPQTVEISSIREEFASDMQAFATQWTEHDTEELLQLIPRQAFGDPVFRSVESIARASVLCQRFPLSVVLLRALILHHFNYIRIHYRDRVSPGLWASLPSFVNWDEATEAVASSLLCTPRSRGPTFSVDRRSARELTLQGSGSSAKCIISQLTRIFRQLPPEALRCRSPIWRVVFIGEPAIDAGGPGRELLTEAAASIFERTSKLTIPTPNGRRQAGDFRDCFLPFDPSYTRSGDYTTVGIIIGIILRSGLAQDLPFAPVVWKHLAGEKIGAADLFEVDAEFKMVLDNVKMDVRSLEWTVEDWTGRIVPLPGHAPGDIVRKAEIERYIAECIRFRMNTIKPPLKAMRAGFRSNTGFKRWPLLTGALLSRTAQGMSVITVDHLHSITVYAKPFENGANHPLIKRFWRTVARFQPEEMKLLLKFITGLTRLPNGRLNPDFRIIIDKQITDYPDQALPTAATCFQLLRLPAYSSDEICHAKLLYAIKFCQTMEEK
jgi:hypothetical protein